MLYAERMVISMAKEKKLAKTAKPKYNMWQNAWFMIRLAWTVEEKKVIILCLLSAVCAVGLNLAGLFISPAILSAVERHASVSELVRTIVIFTLTLMLMSAASAYVDENTLYGRISVRCELIARLADKSSNTSYPNLFNDSFRKLNEKAQDAISSNASATEAIWTTLTDLVANILGFGIYVALLSTIQPVLMFVILFTSIVSYFIGNYVNSWGYRHREEEGEAVKHLSYIFDSSSSLLFAKDIRIFGLRPWLMELRCKAMAAYTAFQRKAQSIYILARIADLILAFIRNAIAYTFLINLVLNNGLSISEFLLYFSAVGGFTVWISGILGGFNTLNKQSIDISTVRECLDFNEPFRFEDGMQIESTPGEIHVIELRNVSFRYPGSDKDTLSGINLTLHPGEKLAVVGLNGAGKSTLIKLLCGFLDPTEGQTLLDGQDIRCFNRGDYYKLFSAAFQTFTILAGTIAVNVAQDIDNIDVKRVKECIEKAGLKNKVESLSQGYETPLNREVFEDAVLLSGGETQRLMLACALYKDAPFIILDEPTAALDPIAESELYTRYSEMTNGKSSIFISHRLASTRFCDRIIMLADGKISEEGTHEELLAKNGGYAELYEVQSRYYKEGDQKDE